MGNWVTIFAYSNMYYNYMTVVLYFTIANIRDIWQTGGLWDLLHIHTLSCVAASPTVSCLSEYNRRPPPSLIFFFTCFPHFQSTTQLFEKCSTCAFVDTCNLIGLTLWWSFVGSQFREEMGKRSFLSRREQQSSLKWSCRLWSFTAAPKPQE